MSDFQERWLRPGAVVPLDPSIIPGLLNEIAKLRALVEVQQVQIERSIENTSKALALNDRLLAREMARLQTSAKGENQ